MIDRLFLITFLIFGFSQISLANSGSLEKGEVFTGPGGLEDGPFKTVLSSPARSLGPDAGEIPYVPVNLLSDLETQIVTDEFNNNLEYGRQGTLTLVFPQNKKPIVKADEIRNFLINSHEVIVSFPGLPTTTIGALNSAKAIAQKNQKPVLAVTIGLGDQAVILLGPTAFMVERRFNAIRKAHRAYLQDDGSITEEPVATPLHQLMHDLGGEKDYIFYAHSVGAIKASNLLFRLEEEDSPLLPQVTFITYGIGVNAPENVKGHLGIIGNLDEFGRINSPNLQNAIYPKGGKHSVRSDLESGLPLITVEEARNEIAQLASLEALSGQAALNKKSQFMDLLAEIEANVTGEALVEELYQAELRFLIARLSFDESDEERNTLSEKAMEELQSLRDQRRRQILFIADFQDYLDWSSKKLSECNDQELLLEKCSL